MQVRRNRKEKKKILKELTIKVSVINYFTLDLICYYNYFWKNWHHLDLHANNEFRQKFIISIVTVGVSEIILFPKVLLESNVFSLVCLSVCLSTGGSHVTITYDTSDLTVQGPQYRTPSPPRQLTSGGY